MDASPLESGMKAMQHPDGRATDVPIHSGETIGTGLLSKILKDVEMTKDELVRNRR